MSGLEVIGTVASIAQLAGTAYTLSKTLYELGDAITNASEDIRSLAHDLSLFSQSLVQLQRLLELNKGAYNLDIYVLVERIIRECSLIHDKISKLIRKLGKDGMKARFKWLYKEKRIRDLMTKLRDMKITLLGILNTLQLDLQLTQLNISTESKIQRTTTEGDASLEYLEWKKLQEENAKANTPDNAHVGSKTGEIGFGVTNIKTFSQNSSVTTNSVSTGTTRVASRGREDDTRSIMTVETFKTAVSSLPQEPENNEGRVDLFGACEPREKAWRVEMAALARAHFGMSERDATAWAEGLALPEVLSKVSAVHGDVKEEVVQSLRASFENYTERTRERVPGDTDVEEDGRWCCLMDVDGLPGEHDPMVEIGYGDGDSDVTNPPPIIEETTGGTQQENKDHWSWDPTQEDLEAVIEGELEAEYVPKSSKKMKRQEKKSQWIGYISDHESSDEGLSAQRTTPPPAPEMSLPFIGYTSKRFESNTPEKAPTESSQPIPAEAPEDSLSFSRYMPSYRQQSRRAPAQLPINAPWQLNGDEQPPFQGPPNPYHRHGLSQPNLSYQRRSKYQFEADSEDENVDDYLPIAGYYNTTNYERLKASTEAIANTKQDVRGSQVLDRISAKSDKIDDQLRVNRTRLDRLGATPSQTHVSPSDTRGFDLNGIQSENSIDSGLKCLENFDFDSFLQPKEGFEETKIEGGIPVNRKDGEWKGGDDAEISEEQEVSHEDDKVDDEKDSPGANEEKRIVRRASSDTDTQLKLPKEAGQSLNAQPAFPSDAQLSRLWWQAYAKLDNATGKALCREYTYFEFMQFEHPVQDLTDDGKWATKTTQMVEKINNLQILLRNSPVPQHAGLVKCLLKVDEVMKIVKTVEGTLGYHTAALGWYSICAVVIKILGFRPIEDSTLNQIVEVAGLVARYAVMENIYHQWQGMTLKKEYEDSLIDLCLHIFKYLVKASYVWRSETLSASDRDELRALFDGIQEADQKSRAFHVIVEADASTTKEASDALGSDDYDWDSDD